MDSETLTPDEWNSLYQEILAVRDRYDRVIGDASTGEIVDAVESWLSDNGFA